VAGGVGDVSAARDAYVAGQNQTIYQLPQELSAKAGRPEVDSWVVALYRSPQGGSPIGSGVVIDSQRVLTCARAVMRGGAVIDEAWVAFPMTALPGASRCLVASIITPDGGFDEDRDVALLELASPVPGGVSAAPLLCPAPKSLVGTKWWSFGFPPVHPHGSVAEGDIGAALADGWVRMDARSAYRIEPGFSGAGLWSSEFGAIVGVVAVSDEHRNGQALTIYQADRCLPGQGLRQLAEESRVTDSGGQALAAWGASPQLVRDAYYAQNMTIIVSAQQPQPRQGWDLATDPEARRHWSPRARGVGVDSEKGYRFRGRTVALTQIKAWLDRAAPDRTTLIVTGAPGSGKSAVLGRIVTTADRKAAAQLPHDDTAVRATSGSVSCAVHANGQTALEVARQIARAASATIPEKIEDFPPALREALDERDSRFNVIIDALDESLEARVVIAKVILPLAETCADAGAQVVIGTRRTDADGVLLAAFGSAATVIDLDAPAYFSEDDLTAYTLATLQRAGDAREGNPYARQEAAVPVATRIAQLSHPNFLVAGLTALTHGLFDKVAVSPAELSFSNRVDDAMREYLKRIPDVSGALAQALLLPLAYAESPGLPVPLWRAALRAIGLGDMSEVALRQFARSSAASFLVESVGSEGDGAEFRLFHQALNDALLNERAQYAGPREDEMALARAFMEVGRAAGWDQAPAYLLRSLPGHASRAGLIDELLSDDSYPLYADIPRILASADDVSSPASQRLIRTLMLSPPALRDEGGPGRAAMLSVTEAMEGLGDRYGRAGIRAPYRAAWTSATSGIVQSVLRRNDALDDSAADEINTVCGFTSNGRTFLASGAWDQVIRIWNPVTGAQKRILDVGDDITKAICAFPLEGRTFLATGGLDQHAVSIRDPESGVLHSVLTGINGGVNSICAFTLDGQAMLAAGSYDGTVSIWNPASGTQMSILQGHRRRVATVCAFTLHGRTLLASGSDDDTVRIWDPATGNQHGVLQGHTDDVRAVCAFTSGGTTLVCSGGDDSTIRVWDPAAGTQIAILEGHDGQVNSACAIILDGQTLLATASDDETVRLWNPISGTQTHVLRGHTGDVTAVCTFSIGGQVLLATGGADGAIRTWDPRAGASMEVNGDGHVNPIYAIAPFALGKRRLYAAAGDKRLSILDAETGAIRHTLRGHTGKVNAVCSLTLGGRATIASGGDDKGIRIWDPVTGGLKRVLKLQGDDEAFNSEIDGIVPVRIGARTRLAACGLIDAGLWNPLPRPWTFRGVDEDEDFDDVLDREGVERIIAGGRLALRKLGWRGSNLYQEFEGVHGGGAICEFQENGQPLLAIGGDYPGTIYIWDPAAGTQLRAFDGHDKPVTAICPFISHDGLFLASSSEDHTVRVWDPVTGDQLRVLAGHNDPVTGVCAFSAGKRALLATSSEDRTVRVWDPAGGVGLLTIPTREQSLSIACDDGLLAIGTTDGMLVLQLDLGFLSQVAR
jgi:WD40 repeat protein